MGSGSSSMAPRPPRHQQTRGRPRLGLAAFLCGGAEAAAAGTASSSAGPPQIEDKPAEKSIIQSRLDGSVLTSNIQIKVKESPRNFSQENSSSSSTSVDISSSQRNYHANWDCSFENSCLEMFHAERTSNLPSTSRKQVEIVDSTLAPLSKVANCTDEHDSCSSPRFSSSTKQLEHGNLHDDETLSIVNPSDDVASISSSNMDYVPVVSSLSTNSYFSSEEPLAANSILSDAPSPAGSSEQRNEGVLHVDLVSISSDVPSGPGAITSESRRNTRRLFWDAFSRQSSRAVDSTSLFSSPDNNGGLAYQNRWLLDTGDHAFGDGVEDDSVYLRRRRHALSGVSWHSRSEIRERLHSSSSNNEGRQSPCPSGLHQDGSCSCTLLMTEVSSTRASIARIFVLAEALFEVLDEIHRQPGSFSLSMVSKPAPESVVGSLPLKIHRISETALSNSDVEQCYICLADYEDGDAIRILPCHHEYHLSCVDKWLKEIHGVCPLCRRDVTEGVTAS